MAKPGREALKTWALDDSFQSTRELTEAAIPRLSSGKTRENEEENIGKSENGSHRSRENGSKLLILRSFSLIGTIDMVECVEALKGFGKDFRILRKENELRESEEVVGNGKVSEFLVVSGEWMF